MEKMTTRSVIRTGEYLSQLEFVDRIDNKSEVAAIISTYLRESRNATFDVGCLLAIKCEDEIARLEGDEIAHSIMIKLAELEGQLVNDPEEYMIAA